MAISAAIAVVNAWAFSSQLWLEERNDDSDARRLQRAYTNCLAHLLQPAENVTFPLENHPDGTVKSRLKARRAQLFLDTGLIWGEGVRVEEYDRKGVVKNTLEADNCVVDRNARTGWVQGSAKLCYGDTTVSGCGIYFSFNREFIKIFSKSTIRSKGLKTDPRSIL